MDQYQGRDKLVIIYSCTRSNDGQGQGAGNILLDTRRLNVAVTRARRQLIVVCDTETVKGDKFLAEFVEYLEAEAEVMTPDMYTDLPDIDRPEGMVVALDVKNSSSNVKSDNTQLKSLNKEKSKTVKKDKTKAESKPSVKEMDNKTASGSLKSDEVKQVNNFSSVEEQEESSDPRRKEFEDKLNSFVASTENFMTFSSDLNSFERRLVHEISEELCLDHESIGEGTRRYIMISKRIVDGSQKENKSVKNTNQHQPVTDKTKEDTAEKENQDHNNSVIVPKETECVNCKRMVPKSNIDLHKLRCKIQPVQLEQKTDAQKPKGGKGTKNKKKEAKAKVDPATKEDDDFDSLCNQFQKLDKVCNFPKCKALVATIGVTCKFCGVRFCLTHSMAEVHGCGEAARTAARQQITREGRLVPGSGAVNHKPDRDKRAQLEKRLDKKLGEKKEQRQTKKKDKNS